jgi:hypothetical protein
MIVQPPYLIQRAEIIKPLVDPNERISNAVKFEYMGSAEFEFGALPESLRAIHALGDKWNRRTVNEIKEGEASLRVYSAFNDEEFEEYKQLLLGLRDPKSRVYTKESTYFEEGRKETSKYVRTDFWWDLDNHTMFGFDKEFMNRLPIHLAASWRYMDEQKKK